MPKSRAKKQAPLQNVSDLFSFGKGMVSDLLDDLHEKLQTQVGDNVRFVELAVRTKPLYDTLVRAGYEPEEAFLESAQKTFSDKPQKVVKGEKK